MSNTSNFRQAMQEARQNALVGPNVIQNALPFVGGGLILTAAGVWGGVRVLHLNPSLFQATFLVSIIAQFALFFVAQAQATNKANNVALPLLATYSLLSGYTLSALVYLALGTQGVGLQGIEIAAAGCGITFLAARPIGSNLSDEDGMALSRTIRLGIFALLFVIVAEMLLAFFGVYAPQPIEIGLSALGVLIFVGAAVVDFYVLPRTYQDDEYLPAALSMYLTYVNLFVFILRLLLAFNSRD